MALNVDTENLGTPQDNAQDNLSTKGSQSFNVSNLTQDNRTSEESKEDFLASFNDTQDSFFGQQINKSKKKRTELDGVPAPKGFVYDGQGNLVRDVHLNNVDITKDNDTLGGMFAERRGLPAVDLTNQDLYGAGQDNMMNVGTTGGRFFGQSNVLAPNLQPDPSFLIASKRQKAMEDELAESMEAIKNFTAVPPETFSPYQEELSANFYEKNDEFIRQAQQSYGTRWAEALSSDATQLGRQYSQWKNSYGVLAKDLTDIATKYKEARDLNNSGEVTLSDDSVLWMRDFLAGADDVKTDIFSNANLAEARGKADASINLDNEINEKWIKNIQAEGTSWVQENDSTWANFYKEYYPDEKLRALADSMAMGRASSFEAILKPEQRKLPREEKEKLISDIIFTRFKNFTGTKIKRTDKLKDEGGAGAQTRLKTTNELDFTKARMNETIQKSIDSKQSVVNKNKQGAVLITGEAGVSVRQGDQVDFIPYSDEVGIINAYVRHYGQDLGVGTSNSVSTISGNLQKSEGFNNIQNILKMGAKKEEEFIERYKETDEIKNKELNTKLVDTPPKKWDEEQVIKATNTASKAMGGIPLASNINVIGANENVIDGQNVIDFDVNDASGFTQRGVFLPNEINNQQTTLLVDDKAPQVVRGGGYVFVPGAYLKKSGNAYKVVLETEQGRLKEATLENMGKNLSPSVINSIVSDNYNRSKTRLTKGAVDTTPVKVSFSPNVYNKFSDQETVTTTIPEINGAVLNSTSGLMQPQDNIADSEMKYEGAMMAMGYSLLKQANPNRDNFTVGEIQGKLEDIVTRNKGKETEALQALYNQVIANKKKSARYNNQTNDRVMSDLYARWYSTTEEGANRVDINSLLP
jgi:hypothetical protein